MADHGDEQEGGGRESVRGRRPVTTRAAVADAALELFRTRGFEEVTVEDIAAAAGISRRTFFRYFESKQEVVLGEFDDELARLAGALRAAPPDLPLMDVLRDAVVATNRFSVDELAALRTRIGLITTVPDLIAHASVRYEAWCATVAGWVAVRLQRDVDDLVVQTVARAALGAATAGFASWAAGRSDDPTTAVDSAFRTLSTGFEEDRLPSAGNPGGG